MGDVHAELPPPSADTDSDDPRVLEIAAADRWQAAVDGSGWGDDCDLQETYPGSGLYE